MNAEEQSAREGRKRMAKKGNEDAPEATEKAEKGEGYEGREAGSPESGPMGGDESTGHAPMGGGDQKHDTKAGSEVHDVGDERDPSGDSGG